MPIENEGAMGSADEQSRESGIENVVEVDAIHRDSLDSELHKMEASLLRQHIPETSSESSIVFFNLSVRQSGTGVGTHRTFSNILRMPVTAVHRLLSRKPTRETIALDSIDGVVRAGEMLLVLGRPPSTSSLLLKILGCQSPGGTSVTGNIKYNGVDIQTFKAHFEGDSIYAPDVDIHFPHINVGNTLDFANETKLPWRKVEGETRARFMRSMTEGYAQLLGLQHTLRTKVGNEYVHGISGGERKRVTLAEALATRASVMMLDSPTHGLDSSTALDFIRMIRNMTTTSRKTVVVALYQAGENLFNEFDKVTLLYLGRQIFFGKTTEAKKYFEDMGFKCTPQQTTADFLTAITDPSARRVKAGWESQVPRSPEDFVRLWKNSAQYHQLRQDLQQYAMDFSHTERELQKYAAYHSKLRLKHQRRKSIYSVGAATQFHANCKRAFYRLIGDKVFIGAMAFTTLFMSLITGSMFYDVPNSTDGFFSKGGALFFAVLFNVFLCFSELNTQFAQRPIVQRQRTYAMYHPAIEALAGALVEYPYKLLNTTVFDIVMYFMVGLKQTAGAFFILWLTTYLITLTMSGFFRSLAAVSNSAEAVIGIAGICMLPFTIYTGYLIPKPSMHPWFKWITYLNPVQYAFEVLVANEFHGTMAPCASLVPSGSDYANTSLQYQVCSVTGAKTGERLVSGDDYINLSFDYSYSHVWRNIGILFVFWAAFLVMSTTITELRTKSATTQAQNRLDYRRGHEPDVGKDIGQRTKFMNDCEAQISETTLREVKSHLSQFSGFVKSTSVFTWEDISYDIALSDHSRRRLLDNVSGYVRPGTLTALMGESGAGKTTLLQVVAQRMKTGIVSGRTLVNGSPPGHAFRRMTGYVQQQDVHLPSSTVREALQFSAKLRQPKETPLVEKLAYVEKVIDLLEMQDFAEAIIGIPGRGLDNEQRKRTTIAVELVAKPEILLFLDEPTSGLDSLSAWSIVRLLRKLADSGQAILCTIHQPSSLIFEQFDRLLLLAKGGKPVYFGDIAHHSRTVIDYFESHGAPSITPGNNPPEWMLDVIGAGSNAATTNDWNDIWTKSELHREAAEEIKMLNVQHDAEKAHNQDHNANSGTNYAEPWWVQYRAFQYRLFLHYWRTVPFVVSKIMLNVVAGLFLGFTFYKADSSVQGLQNKLFAAFTSVILAMPVMHQFQPHFDSLVQLFEAREKPSKMYHWTIFVLSTLVTETCFNLVTGTLFFLPWYFAIGFWRGWPQPGDGERGVYIWLMIMIFELWLTSFGVAVSSLAPNPQTAATLVTFFAFFVVGFNGVLQPLSQLPQFWHWMYHLSPYTYLLGGIISTAIHDNPIVCKAREINVFQPPPGQTCGQYAGPFLKLTGYVLNPDSISDCQYCRYANGDQYLKTRNLDYKYRWRNLGIVAGYVAFNTILAFVLFYIAKVMTIDFKKLGLWRKCANWKGYNVKHLSPWKRKSRSKGSRSG